MLYLQPIFAREWAKIWRFRTLAVAEKLRKRLPGSHWRQRQLFGYQFNLDLSASNTHALLWLEGERMIAERFLLRLLLKPGMSVVDVGANLGYYLLFFESVIGVAGHVCLIEPSPENLSHLEKNIEANHFGNVALHPIAVGQKEGVIGLRSGINSGVTGIEQGAYKVPIKPLDAVVDRKVDFIKIDVEGFELDVLRGAASVLHRDRPILFLEVHPHILPRFGATVDDIQTELRKYYSTFDIFYLLATPSGINTKIAERYFNCDAVIKAENNDAFLENSSSFVGSDEHTFWIVAPSQA